ncbi:MAG TPA: SDR family NAD(P)-dependent oxidoreductase [Rhodospirillales bacterium]|nr:SDR family NAD(P)-dependent oxidoreductase [Rhodospirillales bacterium]
MSELEKLSGNMALIIGAASPFGLAIAKRLAAEGCTLHLADGNETDLEDALQEIGLDDENEPETHPTDVTNAINVSALALECEEVNILINTLPTPPDGGIGDLDHGDWQRAFDNTVLTAINITTEVYESLQDIGTGMIFNIGCCGQPLGRQRSLCQDTLNAALRQFSENLDKEAALRGVRVYFRQPGMGERPEELADDVVGQILAHQAS